MVQLSIVDVSLCLTPYKTGKINLVTQTCNHTQNIGVEQQIILSVMIEENNDEQDVANLILNSYKDEVADGNTKSP